MKAIIRKQKIDTPTFWCNKKKAKKNLPAKQKLKHEAKNSGSKKKSLPKIEFPCIWKMFLQELVPRNIERE